MDTIDMVYSELKELRQDVRSLRKENKKDREMFFSFKMKVIMYAAVTGVLSGGVTTKVLSILA